ncbi:MAG: hypothetical protein E7166_01260 [Firmicutes bacterium]|nr:hypothetical protein [Bacillota bacterium]
MKKKNKIIIIILIILTVITMLGLIIYNFYKGYKEDKIKTQNKIIKINENYTNFNYYLNEFNNQRTTIYSEIFEDKYYSDFNNNINNWNTLMSSYNDLIKKIDNESKYLKENCINSKIYHIEITPKCSSFVDNLEMMINLYISDVNVYNENINTYNAWVLENPEESYNVIDNFINKDYTVYVDFNNDGVFLGKE